MTDTQNAWPPDFTVMATREDIERNGGQQVALSNLTVGPHDNEWAIGVFETDIAGSRIYQLFATVMQEGTEERDHDCDEHGCEDLTEAEAEAAADYAVDFDGVVTNIGEDIIGPLYAITGVDWVGPHSTKLEVGIGIPSFQWSSMHPQIMDILAEALGVPVAQIKVYFYDKRRELVRDPHALLLPDSEPAPE